MQQEVTQVGQKERDAIVTSVERKTKCLQLTAEPNIVKSVNK